MLDDIPEDDQTVFDGDLEVVRTFQTLYPQRCVVTNAHKIKKGDRVGAVRLRDNPLVPITGVACSLCIRLLPRAAREH